jgi:molybdopterin biosynthesis enzyme
VDLPPFSIFAMNGFTVRATDVAGALDGNTEKPFIYHLSGAKPAESLKLMATLNHPIETDGRESYLRAKLTQGTEGYEVGLVGNQDSGVLSSLVEANAIIRVPAGTESLAKGARVEVLAMQNERFL